MDVLEGIVKQYPKGEARLQRLLYLAEHVTTATTLAWQTPSTTTTSSSDGVVPMEEEKTATNDNDNNNDDRLEIQRRAYQLLDETCRAEGNVVRYKQIFGPNNNNTSAAGSSTTTGNKPSLPGIAVVSFDASWVEEQERVARQSQEVLKHRLEVAQSQLIKESIRAAYLALAQHAWATGDLVAALHAMLRAKDYCTNRPQTLWVCLQIVATALALQNYLTATEYIQKLVHTMRTSTNTSSSSNNSNNTATATTGSVAGTATTATTTTTTTLTGATVHAEVDPLQVQTAAALERLAVGDFTAAHSHLMQVVCHPHHDTSGNTNTTTSSGSSTGESTTTATNTSSPHYLPYWIAAEDLSWYAAFLCLAVGTSSDCRVLSDHVSALEAVPDGRRMLADFEAARYALVWKRLVQRWPRLRLDPFLGPHLPALWEQIREKTLLAYWKAYQRVSLATMIQDLQSPALVGGSNDDLRKEWVQLIARAQNGGPHDNNNNNNNSATTTTSTATKSSRKELIGITGGSTTAATTGNVYQDLVDTRWNAATDALERDPPPSAVVGQTHRVQQLAQSVLDDTYSMVVRLACQEHDLMVVGDVSTSAASMAGWRRKGRGRPTAAGGFDPTDDDDDEDLEDAPTAAGGAYVDAAMVDAMNPEDLY